MRKKMFVSTSMIFMATMLVGGCASNNVPTNTEYSGFIEDYSNLQQTSDSNGQTFLRYVNPKLAPANYSAVIVEPLVMYPKAEPSDQLSQATIDHVRGYGTTMAVNTVAGAPQQARLLAEGLGTDSVSGEILTKVVRTHTGERLQRVASNMPVITFESVKPIMDD